MSCLINFQSALDKAFEQPSGTTKISGSTIAIGNLTTDVERLLRDDGTETDLESFLQTYELDAQCEDMIVSQAQDVPKLKFVQLENIGKNSFIGVHQWPYDSKDFCTIFSGKYDDSPFKIETFPELILAVCLFSFDPPSKLGLSDILYSIGPFAVFSGKENYMFDLARHGFKAKRTNNHTFLFKSGVPHTKPALLPSTIPSEAYHAYMEAMSTYGEIEFCFFRMYRVLEVLFSKHIKDEITNCSYDAILNCFNKMKKLTEKEFITGIISKSRHSYNLFQVKHFKILFGTTRIEDTSYNTMSSWASKDENTFLTKEAAPQVIYYIRCAVVHSKISANTHYLMPPFDTDQTLALSNITFELQAVVEDLLDIS